MSNLIKAIGVIIVIIGSLGWFATMVGIENDAGKMSLPEYFSVPHLMKTTKAFIGEAIVFGFGFFIIWLGFKLCPSSD